MSRQIIKSLLRALVARADNGDYLVAKFVVSAGNRVHRRNADAAANADNGAELAHFGRASERADNVENIVAFFKGFAKVFGGVAYCLHD